MVFRKELIKRKSIFVKNYQPFMKKIFTLLLFGTFFVAQAQYKLKFTYDPVTGSQSVRELCFGCQTAKPAREIKEIEELASDDLKKFFPEDAISYYPNPVKEELYLRWELIDQNNVTSIQVYSIGGQILKSYSGNNTTTINIPFQNYSAGIYLIQMNYASGASKTIKIIKK